MNELAKTEPQALEPAQPTALSILEAAVRNGITQETVGVVEKLVALRRDEMREHAKTAFNQAFFRLRKEIGSMELYADKAMTVEGKVAFRYASEVELATALDPVLLRFGFAMMFGQRQEDGKVVAVVTLVHEEGHEELREYSVRAGDTNRVKDATKADAGAATTAWRHLVIKLFGLKSRIRESDDARNLGSQITPEQAGELERRCKELNSDIPTFLRLAGAASFKDILSGKYDVLDQVLRLKERNKKA